MLGQILRWSGTRRDQPPPPSQFSRALREAPAVDELAFHLYRLERAAGRVPDGLTWGEASQQVKSEYRRRATIAWHLGDPIKVAVMPERACRGVDPSVPSVPRFVAAAIVQRALRFLSGEGE